MTMGTMHWKDAYYAWLVAKRSRREDESVFFDRFARSYVDVDPPARVWDYVLGFCNERVRHHSVGPQLDPKEIATSLLTELWTKGPEIEDLVWFLYTLTHRRTIDAIRRIQQDRWEDSSLLETISGGLTDDEPALLLRAAQLIEQLPPDEAYVLIRVELDGASLGDVAQELGHIYNTVVQRHSRARRRLKPLLLS
jgi:DNA-directed RNA polymerase specialized sigma24 family protein